jgi:protein phosphatase
MADPRPPHFTSGAKIGRHHTVEGLVRLAEGRMFYLLSDDRPDQPRRRCWSCQSEDSPRSAKVCHACGAPMTTQRFLMSSRWDTSRFAAFEQLAAMRVEHPGLALPIEVLRHEDQLLAIYPYRGEGLMLDEASPLSNQRVLHVGQRVVGVLAALAQRGVKVGEIGRQHLLISPNGTVRLFDVDVVDVLGGPVPPMQLAGVMRELAVLLRRHVHVSSVALADFLDLAAGGDFPTTRELGRALESRFDTLATEVWPATLGGVSDVGLTRQLNEDAWGWVNLGHRLDLFVLADGMGGHDAGEVASALAVETLLRTARERAPGQAERLDALESLLEDSFQSANNAVKAEAERRGTDMGTTLVGMLVHDNRLAFVANVGDSRAYLLRDGVLHQISVDHSFVQKLVERGRLTAEEARNHPQSNILLRTVGTERDVEIDLFRVDLLPGDKLMMCSDGLWGEVSDADMLALLRQHNDPRAAVRELVRASHHGGGKDNCTIVLVAIR